MREILFRGFHPSDNGTQTIRIGGEKVNGEWVYGDLAHNEYYGFGTDFVMHCDMQIWSYDDIGNIYSENILPQTVGQYTGLNDSTKWEQLTEKEKLDFLSELNPITIKSNTVEDWKGKKIFENDKIRFKEWNGGKPCWVGIVKYEQSRFIVSGNPNEECESTFYVSLSGISSEDCEVIGTTFDCEDKPESI